MSELKKKLERETRAIIDALEPISLKAFDLCDLIDSEIKDDEDMLYEAWDLKYALEETIETAHTFLNALDQLDKSPE